MMDNMLLAELRTEQAESRDVAVTRRRALLMAEIQAGNVRLRNGVDVLDADDTEEEPLGVRVRVLWSAGLTVLDHTHTWRLTTPGVRRAGAAAQTLIAAR